MGNSLAKILVEKIKAGGDIDSAVELAESFNVSVTAIKKVTSQRRTREQARKKRMRLMRKR